MLKSIRIKVVNLILIVSVLALLAGTPTFTPYVYAGECVGAGTDNCGGS